MIVERVGTREAARWGIGFGKVNKSFPGFTLLLKGTVENGIKDFLIQTLFSL